MSETAQKRLRDDEREALMAAFHARDHAGSYVLPPHCHGCVEFVYDFEPLVCELIAARLIGFTAELSDAIRADALAPVLALADSLEKGDHFPQMAFGPHAAERIRAAAATTP